MVLNRFFQAHLLTLAINALNVAQHELMNILWEEPALNEATLNFSAMLEYLPMGGEYDYISNYISHYVYGVW